jgi:ABC-type nitrate/sulfonate/bicarbonate transport system permease component
MQATTREDVGTALTAEQLGRPRSQSVLKRIRRGRFTRHLPALLSWGIGIALWEILGHITNPFIFASFSESVKALWELLRTGVLMEHAAISMVEFGIGFSIGALFGLLGGLAAGLSRTFRDMTDNWVTVFLATPFAAVFPIFLVWFGLGASSKVALAIFACFIPVWLNTRIGVSSVDRQLLEMAHSFRARWRHVFGSILLPWSLPSVMEGLRMGVGRAFLAVIVGELLASRGGLGFLIALSGETLRMDNLLAVVIVVTGITVALSYLMKRIQRVVVPWWEEME